MTARTAPPRPLPGPSATPLRDYFSERMCFFNVSAVTNPDGSWDVVLRIDGTYSDDAKDFGWGKEEMVEYHKERLIEVLLEEGLGISKAHSWYR